MSIKRADGKERVDKARHYNIEMKRWMDKGGHYDVQMKGWMQTGT